MDGVALALGAIAAAGTAGTATGIWLLRRRTAVVTVAGMSMEPALAAGDRILVRRASLAGVRAGDIVLIERPGLSGGWAAEPPRWPPRNRNWIIKRVAALPGDPRPDALLPAVPADRAPADRAPADADPGGEPRVPAGAFVVTGDNAEVSFDSRRIGYIPGDRLLGMMIRRIRG